MPPITEQSPATEQRRGSPQADLQPVCATPTRVHRSRPDQGENDARRGLGGGRLRRLDAEAEKSLIDDGKAPLVMELRREFQNTMGADLSSAVEEVLDRKVIAFMSANHLEPDLAAEVFILESDPRSDGLPNPSSDGVSPTN